MEAIRCNNCGGQLIQRRNAAGVRYLYCVDCCKAFFVCSNCNNMVTFSDVAYTSESLVVCEACRPHYIRCRDCGAWVRRIGGDYITVDRWAGQYICMACFTSNYFQCSCCGDIYHDDDGIVFYGQIICPRCHETETAECTMCHEANWTENMIYDDDDGLYYCTACQSLREQSLHSYSYKPAPKFHTSGDKDYFLGVELEVDDTGGAQIYKEELADDLRYELSDNESLFYCKKDSSLEAGIEIVSHPCNLNFHLQKFPWKDILDYCKEQGYVSHDAGTCGLHIHVNREAFGGNEKMQELNILKLIYLFEKNFDFFKYFSRRRSLYYCSNYKVKNLKDCTETVKYHDKKSNGRYYAINLENSHTVEIRLWRGTLKYNTFIATLQFTKLLIDFVKEFGIGKIVKCNEKDILSYVLGKYRELDTYLKEKELI